MKNSKRTVIERPLVDQRKMDDSLMHCFLDLMHETRQDGMWCEK